MRLTFGESRKLSLETHSPDTQLLLSGKWEVLPALEETKHLGRSLEHPDPGAGERPITGLQLQIEMGPAAPQVQGCSWSAHTLAEGSELADVVGGRKHVGPSSGKDVFPVHHDHVAMPSLRKATVFRITSGSRITARWPRPLVVRSSAPGQAAAISSPWAYGTSPSSRS